MMDGVDLPNDSGNQGKWRIWMPDGTTRMVKGKTSSDQWITGVAHGKYMDIVPVEQLTVRPVPIIAISIMYLLQPAVWSIVATTRTRMAVFRCRMRVRFLVYAYDVGSRLAFRGRLVKAESVEAYKALSEIA